jgi:hypothetical protein
LSIVALLEKMADTTNWELEPLMGVAIVVAGVAIVVLWWWWRWW